MRYSFIVLSAALFCSGCDNASSNCSSPETISSVIDVAVRNMDHLSKIVFDDGDLLASAYTKNRPTMDSITTIESSSNNTTCRAIMHLSLDEDNVFAQLAKEQGAPFVKEQKFLFEYILNPTDDGKGVSVDLIPMEKASK